MIRRPPRSTLDRSSAASDVYKRQQEYIAESKGKDYRAIVVGGRVIAAMRRQARKGEFLSLIHISEPTRPY